MVGVLTPNIIGTGHHFQSVTGALTIKQSPNHGHLEWNILLIFRLVCDNDSIACPIMRLKQTNKSTHFICYYPKTQNRNRFIVYNLATWDDSECGL